MMVETIMIMIMMIGFVKKRKKKTKQIFFLLVRIGVVLESYWSVKLLS
jgi:predicted cation transporter